MHQRLLAVLCALTLVGALAGCGGGGESDAEVEARVSSQLAEGGLDAKTADCVASVLMKDIGAEKIKDVDLSADEPTGALGGEIAAAAIRATATCEIDPADMRGVARRRARAPSVNPPDPVGNVRA